MNNRDVWLTIGAARVGRMMAAGGRAARQSAIEAHLHSVVSRQAPFALFSNAVRSRALWGAPLPSSTIQVV
jgi:hypothetical protein